MAAVTFGLDVAGDTLQKQFVQTQHAHRTDPHQAVLLSQMVLATSGQVTNNQVADKRSFPWLITRGSHAILPTA